MNNLNKKGFIIFSGYNERALLPFMSTLEEMSVPFGVITLSQDEDIIYKTKFRNRIIYSRDSKDLRIEEIASKISSYSQENGLGTAYIAPSSEYLNNFVLNNRKELALSSIESPLVDSSTYAMITNKLSFANICSAGGILVPKQIDYRELNMTIKSSRIVAKPKINIDLNKNSFYPIILNDKEHLDAFEAKYNPDNYFYQEYIGGNSSYLLYYFSRNGDIYELGQDNLVQEPDGKSMLFCRLNKEIIKDDISSKFKKIFTDLNFFGLVMVEVKNFKDNFYVIEANPRMWGPSQLFVDSGYNLFKPMISDTLNKPGVEIKVTNLEAEYSCFDKIFSNDLTKLKLYPGVTISKLIQLKDNIKRNDIYSRYLLK